MEEVKAVARNVEFDLAVIGSGGAAMSAGITAARAGRRVVLIERSTLGGTCVNVGCIPSKMLLAAAGTRHAALTNPFAGAPTSAGRVDLGALVAQKDELVQRLRGAKYLDVAEAYGFEVGPGRARFTSPDTLEVDGTAVLAGAFVVATGAEPAVPNLPGLDGVEFLTSTTAMELAELPTSLVVVGGGYVGMEQAQLFAHLGAQVTVVGRLAPQAEPELADTLRAVFAADGITVVEDRAVGVEPENGGVGVVTGSGRRVTGQQLLMATGRGPRTDGLNLPAAEVVTDGRGFIVINEQQATTNPRVFAAGDVAGSPQHVYVAAATGRVAAANALGNDSSVPPAAVDYSGMPAVVFTRPQLASVGLTEQQALDAGYACDCRVLSLADVPRALVNQDTRGVVKLVADTNTGRVLGVHAAADSAGELMLAATYAIRASMTVDDLADTWAPYLTMAESLRIVAGLFRNQLPTSCCA